MKTIFYDAIIINGYDSSGGLWFSEEFTGSQEALIDVLQRAYSVKEVTYVDLTLGKHNVTFYNQGGEVLPKSFK